MPWFKIQLKDGRVVEIHSRNAIDIYERDFKMFVTPPKSEMPSSDSPEILAAPEEGYPAQIPKPSGTEDAVLKVLSTEWGRASLRSPTEVKNALEHCGYQFSAGAIFGALKGLFDKTKVRRQKLANGYSYGLPLSTS